MTKSSFQILSEHNIVSRYLERLSSPVRPLVLPYHAEQLAQAFAGASSPEPSSPSPITRLEVERYFDVAAVVDGITYNSDADLSY